MALGDTDRTITELVLQARDEATETIRSLGETLSSVGERMLHISEYVIGYEVVGEAVRGVQDLATGLVSANASMEQLTQRFTSLYHSADLGRQAVDWITQFGMTAPFTTQSIVQAGVTVASFGQNITQVLPMLGNLAAVMGTDMPTAAQALMDAFEGRFQMMQRDLHITKDELVPFGLEMDRTGHIARETLIPALEAFVAKNYPQGMANQMKTFTGETSNLQDQWQLLEREMGTGLFAAVKGDLFDLISFLQANKTQVSDFAYSVGTVLGGAARGAGEAFRTLMTDLPPVIGVVRGLFTDLSNVAGVAFHGISVAGELMGTYLRSVVLPVVETALGFALQFWHDHGAQVVAVLNGLGNNVAGLMRFLASNIGAYLEMIKGEWEVAWGIMTIVVGGALDLLSGNTARFGVDWEKGWQSIWRGAVEIVGGGAELMIRLLAAAFGAINDIEHTLYTQSQQWFQGIYEGFATLEEPIIRLVHHIFQPLFDAFNTTMDALHNLSTSAVGQFAHLPAIPRLQMTMQSEDAAIAALHAAATTETHPLGWAPNVGILANVDAAIRALHAQEAAILGQGTFGVGPGVPAFTATQARAAGSDALDAMMARLSAMAQSGLGLRTTGGAGLGPLPGAAGLPVPGDWGGLDPRSAATVAAAAVSQAKEQFQLDILNNAPQTRLLADIAIILSDMKKAGDASVTIALERARDLKLIEGHTGTSAAHAAVASGQAGNPLLSFRTPQEASFGGSIISFASMTEVSNRETMRQLQAANAALQQQVASLQAQLAADTELLAAAHQTAGHAQATAQATTELATRARASSSGPSLRAFGAPVAIR